MKYSSLTFLTLFTWYFSFSQIKIDGTVRQSDSSILSYVNIGIKLKNVGTVTDDNGHFKLVIPEQFLKDTLTFSEVGFEDLNLPLKFIFDSFLHNFTLKPKTNQLNEVVVTGKQLKQKTIGTKSHNPFLSGTAQSKDTNDIIEFAKFVDVNNKVSRIEKANIYLLGVNIDSATFRINFYDIKDGLPNQKIINKNIIERMSVKKGWLTIDLTNKNIVINQNFFISFEFMPEQKLSKYSLSYGGQVGGNYITRKSSLGNWEKGKGASLSAYVSLRQ